MTPSAGVKCAKHGKPIPASTAPLKSRHHYPAQPGISALVSAKDSRVREFKETLIPRYDLRLGMPSRTGTLARTHGERRNPAEVDQLTIF